MIITTFLKFSVVTISNTGVVVVVFSVRMGLNRSLKSSNGLYRTSNCLTLFYTGTALVFPLRQIQTDKTPTKTTRPGRGLELDQEIKPQNLYFIPKKFPKLT